ncbi:MAG: 1-deoxy-D-xylulose-5-phosphate reductoisomerase [Planctomycetia bacterium]|nr:1-deoxy-D-xylulose-5-phosphate reductoisomerase [Planctomycetia bacterium]
MHRIAVLGSTGSIGTNCLEVIGAFPERLNLAGVAARSSWRLLGQQTERFAPRWAVLSDASLRESVPRSAFSSKTELLFGPEGVERLASDPEVDVIVSGIVGAAGLAGTWAALEAGKRVCIANKETLVVAGPLMMDLARRRGAQVIPVDSEHSAVFQALQSGRRHEVRRIVLTASGGPFRKLSPAELERVTPEQALAHPTWNMGRKITIDSATMMNKALEVIEAKWLFGLDVDQIDVVVHPQSVVHSFVEFVDGSVIGQLSPPDMKLPIQYALTWPDRVTGVSPRLDWTNRFQLDFEPPDLERFPALGLGFEVARRGGTCGAVLNAANEAAVERFLNNDIRFCDIARACRAVLEAHDFDPSPSLADLIAHDRKARQEIAKWKS